MERFQGKFHKPLTRLSNWDYGRNAAYFVTICTMDRECFLGKVVDGMKLSEIGTLANKYWLEIPIHFPYVELGAFVVMPNHVHGIIIIHKECSCAINRTTTMIENKNESSVIKGGFAGIKNPMLNDNLSRIIRWYKGRVSFECRHLHAGFAWQSRFYDHVIRSERAYQAITRYINNNPLKWGNDKLINQKEFGG